jgi:hypothetical protein
MNNTQAPTAAVSAPMDLHAILYFSCGVSRMMQRVHGMRCATVKRGEKS